MAEGTTSGASASRSRICGPGDNERFAAAAATASGARCSALLLRSRLAISLLAAVDGLGPIDEPDRGGVMTGSYSQATSGKILREPLLDRPLPDRPKSFRWKGGLRCCRRRRRNITNRLRTTKPATVPAAMPAVAPFDRPDEDVGRLVMAAGETLDGVEVADVAVFETLDVDKVELDFVDIRKVERIDGVVRGTVVDEMGVVCRVCGSVGVLVNRIADVDSDGAEVCVVSC